MIKCYPDLTFLLKSTLFMALCTLSAGCSGISVGTGGSAAPNDTRPSGNALVQGPFVSLNGKSVGGTASVYNPSASSYILRLEGISTPSEQGLQVQLTSSDGQTNFSLRADDGSQNYSFSDTNPGVSFTLVTIYSTTYNIPYGSAHLQ